MLFITVVNRDVRLFMDIHYCTVLNKGYKIQLPVAIPSLYK